MGKEIITQVQETQRVPNRINPRWNTPRHILIKLTKIKHKEQILKAAREKQQVTYKGIPIRITADLSTEILQARREWQDILKVKWSEVKSLSRVWLFETPWTVAYQAPPWDSPGKSTGIGCHFLLQGIFPTKGSNLGLPHSRHML